MRSTRWLWLSITAIAATACVWCLVRASGRHARTEDEKRWAYHLEENGVTIAEAKQMAADVRARRAGPHETTGHLATDVSNLHDDIAHMAAIHWWYAVEDAKAAHRKRWRLRALISGVIAAAAMTLAVLGFRAKARAA